MQASIPDITSFNYEETRTLVEMALSRLGAASFGGASQFWAQESVSGIAGTETAITDSAPTLFPIHSGLLLIQASASFTFHAPGALGGKQPLGGVRIEHSLDGGLTWNTLPSEDMRVDYSNPPISTGIIQANAALMTVLHFPAAVGNPDGIKLRITIVAPYNGMTVTAAAGQGNLVALEI